MSGKGGNSGVEERSVCEQAVCCKEIELHRCVTLGKLPNFSVPLVLRS